MVQFCQRIAGWGISMPAIVSASVAGRGPTVGLSRYVVAFAFVGSCLFGLEAQANQDAFARINFYDGRVKVTNPVKSGAKLQPGYELFDRSVLETFTDTRMELFLDRYGWITLAPSSKVRLLNLAGKTDFPSEFPQSISKMFPHAIALKPIGFWSLRRVLCGFFLCLLRTWLKCADLT